VHDELLLVVALGGEAEDAALLLVGRLKDIRRVFQYHGAEHKTVYTFEANEELTVENARGKSTLHPRCGTSFLVFVMAISIAVFSLVPSTAHFAIKLGARVVLIPLIAGLAYVPSIDISKRRNTNKIVILRPRRKFRPPIVSRLSGWPSRGQIPSFDHR